MRRSIPRATVTAVASSPWGCGYMPRPAAAKLYTRALARSAACGTLDEPAHSPDATLTVAALRARRAQISGERLCRQRAVAGQRTSRLAWDRFGEEADKRTGLRLLKQLQSGYPPAR